MSFRFITAVLVTLLFISPPSGRTQVLTEHDVSVHMALTIAETALAQCGVRASVAVVDRAGRLRVFLQGDGASPHNLELARRKAYTALTFRQTSAEWAARTETRLPGQRMLADVIPLQGGVPIKMGDETIGGVRFLNPGCITRPNRGAPASFAWLEIEAGSAIEWRIVRV